MFIRIYNTLISILYPLVIKRYIKKRQERGKEDVKRFNERIGFYNPMIAEGPQRLTYQEDRLNYWVEKGATMSDTVARIIKTAKKAAAAAPAATE